MIKTYQAEQQQLVVMTMSSRGEWLLGLFQDKTALALRVYMTEQAAQAVAQRACERANQGQCPEAIAADLTGIDLQLLLEGAR